MSIVEDTNIVDRYWVKKKAMRILKGSINREFKAFRKANGGTKRITKWRHWSKSEGDHIDIVYKEWLQKSSAYIATIQLPFVCEKFIEAQPLIASNPIYRWNLSTEVYFSSFKEYADRIKQNYEHAGVGSMQIVEKGTLASIINE